MPLAFVSNASSNSVSVIDAATNSVIATLAVGSQPLGVAVDPKGQRAYVTNYGASSLTVLDAQSLQVVRNVSLGMGISPAGVAVTADGAKVLVAIQSPASDRRVLVYDVATEALRSISVDSAPFGIATHPAQPIAYVTNQLGRTVSVIDTANETVTSTLTGFSLPFSVAVNWSGTRLYVGDVGNDTIREIDAQTLTPVRTYSVVRPYAIAVHPLGHRLYASSITQNRLAIVDTVAQTVATVPVGNSPFGVAIKPEGDLVYVANSGSNNVSVLDTSTNTVVRTIAVQSNPQAFGIFIRPPVVLEED